jgi:hypothetical protein
MTVRSVSMFPGKTPLNWYIKGVGCCLALLLTLLPAVPLHAAEIKSLDNLERNLYANEIRERSLRRAESFDALQIALDLLNTDQEVSSMIQINTAFAQVERSQELLRRASEDLKALAGYLTTKISELKDEELDKLLPLAELQGKTYKLYEESVRAYLDAYRALLDYSRSNAPALQVGRKTEWNQYETLYNSYVSAVEMQGKAANEWMKFMNDFVRKHPGLASYLQK